MCFCLSGCMVNWWTNRSPLAFSFTALYPVFLRQGSDCFVDFLHVIFFWLSDGVESSLNLFSFSLKDLLFLQLGLFFLVITRLGFLHCSVHINLSCSLWSSTSHIPLCRSLFEWLLGYALLTHCDPPALWTPCLPTDDHMLPQHRSGKLSLYSINFMRLVCPSQHRSCQDGSWKP